MKKLLIALALLLPTPALAGVPCSVPFNLQNGTTADASQVMANYNALIACLANAAASGVNSDITALNGLTTPLSPSQGGTPVFLGTTVSGTGNAQVVSVTNPTGFATQQNYTVVYKAIAANTTAATLQVGTAGVATVDKQSVTGPIALTGGEIATGQIIIATWDGSEYQINPVPNVTAGAGLIVSGGTVQISQTHPYYGFDDCVNLQLAASVQSNLLTVAVEAADTGLSPTTVHPVLCPFRDATLANGDPIWAAITTGMSINTNGTGATLGSQNSVPFRLWVTMFYNAASPVLALWQSGAGSSPVVINSLDESLLPATTGISSGATSAGTFYTPNGTSISGGTSGFRIIGYVDYANGLTTAGTYASAPTKVQLFGPGIRKPGEIIQSKNAVVATLTGLGVSSNPTTQTQVAVAISPAASPDAVDVDCHVAIGEIANTNPQIAVQLSRGTGPTFIGNQTADLGATTAWYHTVGVYALDTPGTTSSTSYIVFAGATGGSAGVNATNTTITGQSSICRAYDIQP